MSEPIQSISQGNYILATQQEVSHDNTLSGNGTVDSPLGVVPGYNETVLWSGNCTGVSSVNLSEPLTNFEYGKVIYCPYTANNQVPYKIHEFVPDDSRLIISLSNFNTDFKLNIFKTRFSASNTTFYSLSNAYFDGTWTSANHNNFLGMYKIIGINRKV